MRLTPILCLCLLLTQSACAASYDCAKAGTKVEKMICADPELSKLDEDLGAVYSKVLKGVSDAASLKQQQRDWLTERNSCLDTDCLKSSYRSQIGELTGKPEAGKLLTLLSKDEKLCSAYKNYIEHEVATKRQYGHMTIPMCQRTFGEGFEEFKQVEWREVSPEDYPDLAVQAHRHINNWPWDRKEVSYYLSDAAYKNQLDSIKLNYSYKWWHMWLAEADINNSGDKETLLRVEADGRCGEPMAKPPRWVLPIMVVDKSGKGIDVEKSEWVQRVTIAYPITKYHWPPRTYWPENIKHKLTSGRHSLMISAFDSFSYASVHYFDEWNDEWDHPNKGIIDVRYSSIGVYQILDSETNAVCRFKFRKSVD